MSMSPRHQGNLEHVCLDSAKLKHPRGPLWARLWPWDKVATLSIDKGSGHEAREPTRLPGRQFGGTRTGAGVQLLSMHPNSGLQLQEVVRDGG